MGQLLAWMDGMDETITITDKKVVKFVVITEVLVKLKDKMDKIRSLVKLLKYTV